MTSWRDSSDPRCPECGGKISATASYCMHCDADLTVEDEGAESVDADVSADDDVDYETPDEDSGGLFDLGFSIGSGSEEAAESDVGIESDQPSNVGVETDQPSTVGAESSARTGAGVDSARQDTIEEDAVEKTTLLLRGPVSVIVAFPAALLFLGGAFAGFSGLSALSYGGIFLLAWVGVTGYLLTKPLASDAIGDAFYVYAAVMLLIPPTWILGETGRLLLGADVAIGDRIFSAIAFEFFLLFPAGFFLLLGYGANYYARKKIEAAMGERSGA